MFCDLKNKVAIVTGSGQGIGEGIVRKLFSLGAKVVVADMNLENCEKICKSLGKDCLAIKCDISNSEDVKKMISETIKKFGKLDILVNNAGIYPFLAFEQMTEKDWNKIMDINLKGTFLCCSEAVKKMKKGKIINISSIASFVGFPALTHYCATKGGINSFTRALALELASKKINVNAIAPGAIETPGATKGQSKEQKQQTIGIIPLKRYGKPEDIANAVAFLASDEADYITGQVLTVDGGWIIQ